MKKLFLITPFLLLLTFCKSQKGLHTDATVSAEEKVCFLNPLAYFRFEKSEMCAEDKKPNLFCSETGKDIYINHRIYPVEKNSFSGSCYCPWKNKDAETIFFGKQISPNNEVQNLTIEFAVKFDPDSMNSFECGFNGRQILIFPDRIVVSTLDSAAKQVEFSLDDGGMRNANEFIYDGQWHHFAFRLQGDSAANLNLIRVFIDGKTNSSLIKTSTGKSVVVSNKFKFGFSPDAHSTKNFLDELAIYTEALPDGAIVKHSVNFFAGKPYDFSYSKSDDGKFAVESFPLLPLLLAHNEFAPGFPDYYVSQYDQLKSFPLPRYKPNSTLNRNFPWFDFMYLSYDYSKTEKDAKGNFKYPGMKDEKQAGVALALNLEMYNHWHYYFSIPTPTYNSESFANVKTIPGAAANYANLHPEIETSTVLFWVGIHPNKAGFESKTPYIKSNANINPCSKDTAFSTIQKDGLTQRKNLEALIKVLPDRDPRRKIDFVNENGEVFGEMKTPNAEGYKNNKLISCIQKDSLHARRDRGKWQYNVFSSYSKQFISNPKFAGLMNSKFSFYQISAFLPDYYGDYAEMRKINSKFRGDYYSTPDFYPGHDGWQIWSSHGPYHGLDVIQEGRKSEISLGDNYFSPFICAGWFRDSLNFRPAEWLAATKALGMMGAEFYYPAFFDEGDPNKKVPIDPKGYIYQVAIPAYAQAITSRYEDVFFSSSSFTYYRNYNRLLIYRKDSIHEGNRYAIFAGIFDNSNYAEAVPDLVSNNVNINGDILKINFRKQGSTYIYDKSDPTNVVFYQLDNWQEATHPYYWSKNFDLEAELNDDSVSYLPMKTERPVGAAKGDYTNFTTYVCFTNSDPTKRQLQFHFEPRQDTGIYYVMVHARSASKNPGKTTSVQLSIDGQTDFEITGIAKGEFVWYTFKVKGKPSYVWAKSEVEHVLQVSSKDVYLELDRVYLSTTPELPVSETK